jgi:hypothetical protein
MKVEGIGMGVTLIRRDVMRIFEQMHPELIDARLALHPAKSMLDTAGCKRMIRVFEKLDIPDRGVVSEDISFCIRWNKLGGKIWAAIGYRISHVGPYDYNGCYLEWANEQQAMRDREATAVTVSPPSITGAEQQIIIAPNASNDGRNLISGNGFDNSAIPAL